MSTKYKATDVGKAYFITITTVGWVDVFTRLNQKYVIINPDRADLQSVRTPLPRDCIAWSPSL